MGMIKSIRCDMCGTEQTEAVENSGFVGWGAIHGVQLNGINNPTFCHECLDRIMCTVDQMIVVKGI